MTACGDSLYQGECADVLGHATGRLADNILNWRYKFNLPIFGRKVTVLFDDVMALQDGSVMVNRAKVSKWGILHSAS